MALDEATLKLSAKKVIYIFNSEGGPFASDVARLLATQSAKSVEALYSAIQRNFQRKIAQLILQKSSQSFHLLK